MCTWKPCMTWQFGGCKALYDRGQKSLSCSSQKPRDIVLDADSRAGAIQQPKAIKQGRAQSYGELQAQK